MAMATTAEGRAPAHLWIVGILSLLWNAYGCYDYLMMMTADPGWMSKFPQDAVTYWESLPSWLSGFWAVGVWGGLAGAVLLLVRSRYSVWAYGLSFVGAVVGIGYQLFMTDMPESMQSGSAMMLSWAVIIIAAFQLWYSWSHEKKGVLR